MQVCGTEIHVIITKQCTHLTNTNTFYTITHTSQINRHQHHYTCMYTYHYDFIKQKNLPEKMVMKQYHAQNLSWVSSNKKKLPEKDVSKHENWYKQRQNWKNVANWQNFCLYRFRNLQTNKIFAKNNRNNRIREYFCLGVIHIVRTLKNRQN